MMPGGREPGYPRRVDSPDPARADVPADPAGAGAHPDPARADAPADPASAGAHPDPARWDAHQAERGAAPHRAGTDPLDPVLSPATPGSDPPVWRPVSDRQIWVVLAGIVFWSVVLAGIGVIAWLVLDSKPALLGAVVVAVLGLIRASVAVRSIRSWGYAERDDDLLVRHGLLVRRLSIVPYARMQFVDVTAGPLERALGLATVALHTAAAASDAKVPGLAGPEAARLRDRLTALGDARSEGL